MNILISGAGIAGPTLAYWLLEHGFEPTLVEEAPRPRSGGYVVDFWGSGFDIAEKMGLLPELVRRGYLVKEVRIVGADGRRVGGFPVRLIATALKGRFVTLPRSELALAIYAKIKERCESIFGDRVVRLNTNRASVDVEFETAPPRKFDLVIGGDGLHSVVRKLAFGAQHQFEKYLDYKVAAFEATGYRPRDELVYVAYGVPGKQVARFALREDKTLFFLVFVDEAFAEDSSNSLESHKAALRRVYHGAGWETDRILGEAERAREIYLDRVSQIHMPHWSRGRVALLGDAAFCPSLLAGEGAGLAMTAAYILAGELARSRDDHERAFANYERRMRPLVTAKQNSAARFASSFAPRTRLGLVVRNLATKAMGLPFVAELTLLRGLRDDIELPDYRA